MNLPYDPGDASPTLSLPMTPWWVNMTYDTPGRYAAADPVVAPQSPAPLARVSDNDDDESFFEDVDDYLDRRRAALGLEPVPDLPSASTASPSPYSYGPRSDFPHPALYRHPADGPPEGPAADEPTVIEGRGEGEQST